MTSDAARFVRTSVPFVCRAPCVSVGALQRTIAVFGVLLLTLATAACASGESEFAPPPTPRAGDSARIAAEGEVTRPPLPSAPLTVPDVDAGRPVFPRVDEDRPAALDAVLYRIGEREIRLSELGVFLLRYFPDRAGDALTQLLDEALAAAEADREGVSVSSDQVTQRTEAYLAERRKQVRLEYGADADLETVLQQRYGRSLAAYRRDARRLATTQLLIDRLVLLDLRRQDRVAIRVLVFDRLDDAQAAVTRLRAGADMTLLARSEQLRAPVSPPPFSRSEIDDEDLAAKLFAAAAGDYIDPVAFRTPDAPGRTFQQVFRVVRHLPGTAAPWSELRNEIEQELASKPGTGPRAYLRWKRRVLARANVEVRDAAKGFVPWTHAGSRPERGADETNDAEER